MKLKINEKYWQKTDGWQKVANKNLWIAIVSTIILAGNYMANGNYIFGGAFAIVFFVILLPQRISYSRYSTKKLKKELKLK